MLEIKLRKNAEARRAVVAQVLTYAAHLNRLAVGDLEQLLRSHLSAAGAASILDAAAAADSSGDFDRDLFAEGLHDSLALGRFRLVLVLDEAPAELVQLVGYLESITSGVLVDLITVSSYEAGNERILVPQRVDPEHQPDRPTAATTKASKAKQEIVGSEAFEESIVRAAEPDRESLHRLLRWARALEADGLATLQTVLGSGREVLKVWVPGEKGGLASVWNDSGAYVSLWRSLFVKLAWDHIETIEEIIGVAIGQGNTVRDPDQKLLDALTEAYRTAASTQTVWNGRDFYVAFGENDQRNWDDAIRFGFVSAGGGDWYSRTLRQLQPGHRVFVYIPKGSSGVGGYVGVGTVTEQAMMARDFTVGLNGDRTPYLEAALPPNAGQYSDDPEMSEWVVPVDWLATRTREEAVRNPDFFANQNSAVRLTHGYTLDRLTAAFGVER